MATENIEIDYTKYDFKDPTQMYVHLSKKGLTRETVIEISKMKNEPQWMTDFRLRAYDVFMKKPMPNWGADLSAIDFQNIYYYAKASEKAEKNWDDVPEDVKKTFDKLGIPEAEKKFLAGVGAQYESEVVYHNLREDLQKQGVLFLDTETALKEQPEIFKKYFGKIIPPEDNKFAALNSAVWSGGSFIYVPPGVKVDMPLQAYFRINAENIGQFERTLIIADEGSEVHYIEGCFTKGAEIQTSNGTKKIEDITVGDEVLTHYGKYKKVYHTQVRPHSGKLYTITYFGDTSAALEVTGEHPFLISRREKNEYKNTEWKTEWVSANELNVGDYLAMPIERIIDSRDERTFFVEVNRGRHSIIVPLKIKTDKDFFRLVGYYLSEGSLLGAKSGDNYLTFTFNKDEVTYVQDTVELIERYFGKTPLVQKEYNNGISVVLCSTKAARFFKQQFGKGAANKRLPLWVLHENEEKQTELIKGIWRGDGSFMNKNYEYGSKRMFRINTISKVLVKQLRDVLLRIGIFASINEQIRTGKRHDIYCLYVGGENMRQFSKLVGSPEVVEIESGGMKLLSLVDSIQTTSSYGQIVGDYAFVPIKKITAVDVENVPVYNFSVGDHESYVCEGVAVHNCTAPVYSSESLHSAVVELVAHKDAKLRYTTIQNWSSDVYNLVTKRAYAYEGATVEWIDGNIGSKVTMKYPGIYLLGERAYGETLSIAFAGKNQHQDTGAKMVHLAPNTTSKITSKSVSRLNGRSTYRGLLKVAKGATNVKSTVRCDALLLDDTSKTDTYPYMEIDQDDATITHEATVGKIGDEQIFYLMTRGFTEEEALSLIVNGFMEPFTKELPMEYAVELNRLIKLEMDGSVG